MTRVCLLGSPDVSLRQTLLSHGTARDALRTYDLSTPYHNAVGLETVSLGAAVTLLNDLNWYLVRYVEETLVREPSVSADEWLSRDLARAIRDGEVEPAESDQYLKVYGLQPVADATPDGNRSDREATANSGGRDREASEEPASDGTDSDPADDGRSPPALVEPMYVTRAGGSIPEYDLRAVEDTVVVRVTEAEFGR